MSAIKKSISMPSDLWDRLEQRGQQLGYATVSAYFQQLVREDLLRQGAHLRGVELLREPAAQYDVNSAKPDVVAAAGQIIAAGAAAVTAGAVLAPPKKVAKPKDANYRRPSRKKPVSKRPT